MGEDAREDEEKLSGLGDERERIVTFKKSIQSKLKVSKRNYTCCILHWVTYLFQ